MGDRRNSGFAAILSEQDEARCKRISDKIPQWAEFAGQLQIPSSLNLEQCSSGQAALYKASVAAQYGSRIADITGGLGVDCWAFGRRAQEVLYNEQNQQLSTAVAANFRRMGILNTRFCNYRIDSPTDPDNCEWLMALRDFGPDLIYADPARRDGCGNKVFLPSDCSPDITALLPLLLNTAPAVMVKFSPMMDIRSLRITFGKDLRQVHVVCVNGEAKELLCIFGSDAIESALIVSESEAALKFDFESESASAARFLKDDGGLTDYRFLFEPGPGLLKAGLFKYLCTCYGMTKLGRSTHLYLCDQSISELEGFGNFFAIESVLPFGKESFRKLSSEYPHADLTARNLPLSTDELRRRMKITPGHNGPGVHIFAATIDYDNRSSERKMIVSRPCNQTLICSAGCRR